MGNLFIRQFVTLLAIGLSLAATSCLLDIFDDGASSGEFTMTRLAFIGDTAVGTGAQDVIDLIKSEGTDAILVQGDLGYNSNHQEWIEMIDSSFEPSFPIFVSAGNHDDDEWFENDSYAAYLTQRTANYQDVTCEGELGIQSTCQYRGIFMVFIAPNLTDFSPDTYSDADHVAFLNDQLASDDANQANWRICSWHVLMEKMQIGGKSDESGWDVYEACREGGAIIATAHEHSYERTVSLSDMENQTIHDDSKDHVPIGKGHTFAFVSGLGGNGVRDQQLCGIWPQDTCGYWAMVDTSDQGAKHGALFCDFYSEELPANQASCYFKNVEGDVRDTFIIENEG